MLSHISVINFRNYAQCRVAFQPGINVLYGENGAGKTNLLEAISLFTPGRGLRNAQLKDFIPFDYMTKPSMISGWGITGRIDDDTENHTLSTGMSGDSLRQFLYGETTKRHIRINNAEQKSQDSLTEYLSVLWLTPTMDGILSASLSEKRRFFDRISFAFDPAHAGRISRYEKALRSRNSLLKEERPNTSWVKSYHETLAKTGVAIAESRIHTINLLNSTIETLDTPFPKCLLSIQGDVEQVLLQKSALEAEQFYLERLETSLATDMRKQSTEFGIHKSNFIATHIKKNAEAYFCSTGEQKAMLISIILCYAECLSHHRKNSTSLLLLDEMIAHLDIEKRKYLFDYLTQSKLQVIATGTDRPSFSPVESTGAFLKVDHGNIVF